MVLIIILACSHVHMFLIVFFSFLFFLWLVEVLSFLHPLCCLFDIIMLIERPPPKRLNKLTGKTRLRATSTRPPLFSKLVGWRG